MLDDARRLEILTALGIEVYLLRAPAPAERTDGPQAAATVSQAIVADVSPPPEPSRPRLVVACTPDGRGVLRALYAQIARAVGLAPEELAVVETDAASAPQMPETPAYLMLGSEAARACSAQLPLERQQRAAIAVVDDATARARDAGTKRTLWLALKPLARRLRAASG